MQTDSEKKKEPFDTSTVDWYEVLPRLGIPRELIENPRKQGPCPIEREGKTRFRFDNQGGRGTWICNHCGSGDAIALIAKVNGWSDKKAFYEMAEVVRGRNGVAVKPRSYEVKSAQRTKKDIEKARQRNKRTWDRGIALAGTPSMKYLHSRVRDLDPTWLAHSFRHHKSLYHFDEETAQKSFYSALLARVVDASNPIAVVTLHRTYLSDNGRKAPVSAGQVKKLMSATVEKIHGESILLNTAKSKIAVVTEGIEGGLAWVAATKNTVAVYSAMNCNNLANFKWPAHIEKLIIAADHDPVNTKTGVRPGTHNAMTLRERATAAGLRCVIRVPPVEGIDWDDMWNAGEDIVHPAVRKHNLTTT